MTTPTTTSGENPSPAAPFAVTAPPNLTLAADGTGKTTFTVTNLSGRPVKARLKPRGGAGSEDGWFEVVGESEVPIAVGATATVDVQAKVPRKAAGGEHSLLLEVVAEDDTEVVTGQSVSFTVKGGQAKAKPPWVAIIIVVLVLLLLGGAAVWFLVLRTPAAKPVAPKPSASPSLAPAAPNNVKLPKITGTAQVGEVLNVSHGTWKESGLTYSQQWRRCLADSCSDIVGATLATYTPTTPDQGATVEVIVKAKTTSGGEASATAPEVGPVGAADPPGACKDGYAWRLARPDDIVCVAPTTSTQVAQDNLVRETRWVVGAYGNHTCVNGYVWREAFVGDDVCVLPPQRTQAAQDNAAAASRLKHP